MKKLSYYNFFVPYPEENIYLVYNSASNALIEVDWDKGKFISKLNSMELHFLDEETHRLMTSNGMIVDADLNEFGEVGKKADHARGLHEQSDTFFMVIAPTNTCNMNCPYCYQGDKNPARTGNKHLNGENVEALKSLIRRIVETPHASPIKTISIEWFGGEPLIKPQLVEEISSYAIAIAEANGIAFKGSIITNGTLLTPAIWDMLDRNRIHRVQITIDGNQATHDKMRVYLNGKGTYEKIMENLLNLPKERFNVVLRMNGDKEVFEGLPEMLADLEARGIWPQRGSQIAMDWSPKFYDFTGYNQEKGRYYTSYEFQKSKEDFTRLMVDFYNDWAANRGKSPRRVKVMYPKLADFYCTTVESPNSISVDDAGFIHKCYNTINIKSKRIQHVKDFDPTAPGMDHYKNFSKTTFPECATCKVLPICNENCNMRFVDKAESKVCTAWKYFLEDRMKEIYVQTFKPQRETALLAPQEEPALP